ncbi:S49 family peptidase, partial [Candidatus Woesearchaeota archaeon]|nr:S49 family peptidase [Candidatus Woesearchaeota archaeon]
VDEAADGRFYLGIQALDLGLIDELGGKEEAVAWIEDKEDIEAELAEYRKPKSLAEALTEVMSEHGFLMGLGIGQSMTAGAEKGMAIST